MSYLREARVCYVNYACRYCVCAAKALQLRICCYHVWHNGNIYLLLTIYYIKTQLFIKFKLLNLDCILNNIYMNI